MTKIRMMLGLILGLAAPVAQAGPLDDALEARILPGWRMANGQHMAAVELHMAPGWKTYWRAPGDAGIPPRFDWRGSRNLGAVEPVWPTPIVIDQGGVQVIGYKDRVILPMRISPERAGKPVQLKASIDLGVCKDVCVPITLSLSEALPSNVSKPDPHITAAMADRPYAPSEAGVGQVRCDVSPIEDGLRLSASVAMPSAGGTEVMVVELDNPQIWVSQGDARRNGGRLNAEAELYHVDGRAFALDRSAVRITVIGSNYAVDIQGCSAG
ncbi:protein-disulfide reductase DsbD domain-containing protein [Roseovarius faecimaris]